MFLFLGGEVQGQSKDLAAIKHYERIYISAGGIALISFGDLYLLGNLQVRYRYTPRRAIEIGLIKDFYRSKPFPFSKPTYTGFRNGYYIGHQWVLNNPYKSSLWWFGVKFLYTQGDIPYKTDIS